MSVLHIATDAEPELELGIFLLILLKRSLPAVSVGCLQETGSISSPRIVHYNSDIQAVQMIILQKIRNVN
jgi:hypothetical protein